MLKTKNWILMVLLAVTLLSACGGDLPETPPPPTETVVASPQVDTPEPTLLDVPEPGAVVLVSAIEPDPAIRQAVESAATARGLTFIQLPDLTQETAPANLVMVVADAEIPTLAAMTDQMPEVKFVLTNQGSIGPNPNLTIIGRSGDLKLVQAFLAGYIAAVQSEEYRIGIISTAENAGQDFRRAFLNGVIYFCGNCAPIYPPYAIYPQYQELPAGADQESLENAARAMIAEGISMILVDPEHQTTEFYSFLAQNGIRLVGTDAPPAGLEGNWVASVVLRSGSSLESALGALVDGQQIPDSGESVEINYTGVGESRLQHFNQILQKLLTGEIDPLGQID